MIPPETRSKSDSQIKTIYQQVWGSASPTAEMAQSRLFKPYSHSLGLDEKTRITYARAREICEAFSKQYSHEQATAS
jgi:hypothetical protein